MFNQILELNNDAQVEDVVERDSLGGSVRESAVYPATIDNAYLLQAESGAISVNVIYALDDGTSIKQTEFITNREGKNYYTKDNKNFPLPGWSKISSLTTSVLNIPLADFNNDALDEKMVNIYDSELKREVPKEVQVITPLIGAKLNLGLVKARKNKQTKLSSGGYVNTAEEMFVNEFNKYFDENGLTVTEREAGQEEPKFMTEWTKKYAGTTLDLYKEVEGASKATMGAKSSNMFAKKAPTDAPSNEEKKKTLFGKK